MFGISFYELLIILLIAFVALGPEKLPGAAKMLGNLLGQAKRHSDALRREFYRSVYETDEKNIKGSDRDSNLLKQATSTTETDYENKL